MKTNMPIALSALSCVLLVSCASIESNSVEPATEVAVQTKAAAFPALEIVAPTNGATVALLSDGQKFYLDLPHDERIAKFADQDWRNTMTSFGYYPQPVELAWSWPVTNGVRAKFTVCVYRMPDNVPVYLENTVATNTTIDNLEIARDYTWEVFASAPDASKAFVSGTFTTEDHAPRLIRIPGVPNVRDLGGRIGRDGRRVRQGMVIRTAGLNENASEGFFSRDEILAQNPDKAEALLAREAAINAEKSAYVAMQPDHDLLRLSPLAISPTWALFRPDDATFKAEGDAAISALKAIPEALLGANAESVTLDDAGRHVFPREEQLAAKGPAIFIQEIDVAEDGWFSLACGADWYWDIRLDGKVVFDRMRGNGNNRHPIDAMNHTFPVKASKGRHILTAVVYTGSDSWTWCCLPSPNESRTNLLAHKITNCDRLIEELFHVSRGMHAGPSRLDHDTRIYMRNTLGMKTDIDLRNDNECYGMTGSPMGDTVTWAHISSACYGGMREDWGRDAFAKVFRIFLDPANYPIDFHCIAGQDRTGAVACIINALLGVKEEDLFLDWESTGFWNGYAGFNHENLFNHLLAVFREYPGETINEQIEAYVMSLGFTQDDFETLREIMLEPASDK